MRSSHKSVSSEDWNSARVKLEESTLYLVHRIGPTVFNVRDDSDVVVRVMIGNPHSCNCKENKICLHILFILLKVLRIPESHFLCKKVSLSDAEIDTILSGDFGETRQRRVVVKRDRKPKVEKSGGESDVEADAVERQPMDDDNPDICPICQDDMTKDQALTWCRKGCGNNIHAKCMKLYAQYKVTNSHPKILCPLCREDWGPMAIHIINDDCKGKASLRKACATASCSSCTFQIRGPFFRCLECSLFGFSSASAARKKELASSLSNITAVVRSHIPLGNGTAGAPEDGSSTTPNVMLDDATPTSRPSRPPVDFCQRCFNAIGRDHARHHFLTSSSNAQLVDFSWESARNPRAPQQLLDDRVLQSLQNRDLGDEDYDFLLSLDRPQGVTVQSSLLEALPPYRGGFVRSLRGGQEVVPSRQCWCSSSGLHALAADAGNNDDDKHIDIRVLPCGHTCHDSCMSALLDEALSEGPWKLDEIKCAHDGCKSCVFRGISRRRVKKKAVGEDGNSDKECAAASSVSTAAAGSSLVGGIMGLGISSGISLEGSSTLQSISGGQRIRHNAGANSGRPVSTFGSVGVSRRERSDPNPGTLQLEVAALSSGGGTNSDVLNGGSTSTLPPRPVKGSNRHFLTPSARKGLALTGRRHDREDTVSAPVMDNLLTLRRSTSLEGSMEVVDAASDSSGHDNHLRHEVGGRTRGVRGGAGTSAVAKRSVSASRAERVLNTSSTMKSGRGLFNDSTSSAAMDSSSIYGVALHSAASSVSNTGHGGTVGEGLGGRCRFISPVRRGGNSAISVVSRNSRVVKGRPSLSGIAPSLRSDSGNTRNCPESVYGVESENIALNGFVVVNNDT